jgi:hypothetical protein
LIALKAGSSIFILWFIQQEPVDLGVHEGVPKLDLNPYPHALITDDLREIDKMASRGAFYLPAGSLKGQEVLENGFVKVLTFPVVLLISLLFQPKLSVLVLLSFLAILFARSQTVLVITPPLVRTLE